MTKKLAALIGGALLVAGCAHPVSVDDLNAVRATAEAAQSAANDAQRVANEARQLAQGAQEFEQAAEAHTKMLTGKGLFGKILMKPENA